MPKKSKARHGVGSGAGKLEATSRGGGFEVEADEAAYHEARGPTAPFVASFFPTKATGNLRTALDRLGTDVDPSLPLPHASHLGLFQTQAALDSAVAAFDDMLARLSDARVREKYGGSAKEAADAKGLRFGGDVPPYFANVGGQTIYWRKVLSIAGLRNLLAQGPNIFCELQATHFSGHPGAYRGDSGLVKMRRVTGNVVDLDTVVLRCNDRQTLDAVNASHRMQGLPLIGSMDAFSASATAQTMAVEHGKTLCDEFAKALKLTEAQRQARNISLSQIQRPIPQSCGHTERGHVPVWHYVNAGQDSFHVNVPSLDDVVGALLKAPLQCALHYCALYEKHGESAAALQAALDDFFEECVQDSCFNMKWRAIEEFGRKLEQQGSVADVIAKTQQTHQHVFSMDFMMDDDDEHTGEIRELTRLTSGKKGRDSHGTLRLITEKDVVAWVNDPSVQL